MSVTNIAFTIAQAGLNKSTGLVLERLIETVFSVDTINKRVDRLIDAPFKGAKRYLELALEHYNNGEINEYQKELHSARISFHEAASNSITSQKVSSLCCAGICCALLNDNTKTKFYYKETIKEIDSFIYSEREKMFKMVNYMIMGSTGIGFTMILPLLGNDHVVDFITKKNLLYNPNPEKDVIEFLGINYEDLKIIILKKVSDGAFGDL